MIFHGARREPFLRSVGSMKGSHASVCSLYNAASISIVDERVILTELSDQLFRLTIQFDKHIATTDFVLESKSRSSFISIVFNVKTN